MRISDWSSDVCSSDLVVDAVGDGSDALARLSEARANGARYDLLLTDILMPVMDGISLALSASRDAPGLLIVLMTGYSDQRERSEERRVGKECVSTCRSRWSP